MTSPLLDTAPVRWAAGDADLVGLLSSCGTDVPSPVATSTSSTRLPLSAATLAARVPATTAVEAWAARSGRRTGPLVHVSHDVQVEAPPAPGAPLTVGARVEESPRPTSRGSLGGVVSALHTRDGGVRVATVATRFLLPSLSTGAPDGPAGLTGLTGHPGPSPADESSRAEAVVRLDRAAVAAFARLSGDEAPLHLDPGAGRAAGFDGVLAHGSLLLALVEATLRRRGIEAYRLSARFRRPVGLPTAGAVSLDVVVQPRDTARADRGPDRHQVALFHAGSPEAVLTGTAYAPTTQEKP